MGSELQAAEGRQEPTYVRKWGREASRPSSSSVAILASAQIMFGRSNYDNLSAAAICATKRNVRLHGPANSLDYQVRPVDWSIKFEPTLGPYEAFLRGRPDQFEILSHPDGLGHTVKDVTGNRTVAPKDLFISQSPATQERRSILKGRTGSGVVSPLLRSWKQAWTREITNERKQPVVAAVGQRRSPSRNPRPKKRRLAMERAKPEHAGDGGSGDIRRVLGNWVDTCRSEYAVQLDKGGTSCTVTTTRPTGTVKKTRALIRMAGKSIIWGQNYVLDNGTPCESQLKWLRLDDVRGDFVWQRR